MVYFFQCIKPIIQTFIVPLPYFLYEFALVQLTCLFHFKTYTHDLHYICFMKTLDCPGTESSSAGKVSACQGCPNQNICASGETQLPDPGKYKYFSCYLI